MTEAQLQAAVIALAKALGWMVYHTHDSRKSEAGFPYLVIVKRQVLYREIKTETGGLTPAQSQWLAALANADQDVTVWRPVDWHSGRIEEELKDG